MLYTIPDYYKEFSCIADQCEDTCCAGWQIVIDKKTLASYKKIPDEFGRRMRKKINWITGTFRQDKDDRFCKTLSHLHEEIIHINYIHSKKHIVFLYPDETYR